MEASFVDEVPEWIEGALEWQHFVKEHRDLLGNSGEHHCSPDYRSAIFGFAHQLSLRNLWRSVASGLVKPLMIAWERGDARSSLIIEQAVNDLANLHFLVSRNDLGSQIDPLVLYGGVTTHNKAFRELLALTIAKFQRRSVSPIGPWTPSAMRPVIGALLYALGSSTDKVLRMPIDSVVDNVRKSYFASAVELNIQND
jgi:hypothetical protein